MAGGEGRRMRPLTNGIPKPLLPVVDRPLMAHTIDLLARNGITDIVVTVQYLAGQIRDTFQDGSDYGVRLQYVTESEPLGTAGGVKLAEELLSDGPILVISADALCEVDLAGFVGAHEQGDAPISMLLMQRSDPREFGVAVLDEASRVVQLIEKPGWGEIVSDTINTGIYCFDPSILASIPADEPQDWAQDVIPRLIATGHRVSGVVGTGYWEDVGSLPAYLRVQHDVLSRVVGACPDGFEVEPGVWVADGADIQSGAKVHAPAFLGPFSQLDSGCTVGPDAVLGANVAVRRMARVDHSIFMDNSWVDAGGAVTGAIVGPDAQVLRGSRVDEGAVLGEASQVGEEAHLSGEVLVYPGKAIDAGAIVRDAIVSESRADKHLFGPQGISGLINIEVTPDLVVALASALAATLPKGATVTVGRDHSKAARAFNRVAIGALTAGGMNVRDLRIAAVPIIRADTANYAAGGLALITKPGDQDSIDIKVLDSEGATLSPGKRRGMERALSRSEFRRPRASEIGDIVVPHRVAEDYANHLLARIDTAGVAEAGLRLVVDTAGGSASLLLPTLLGRLNVDVLTVNGGIDESQPTDVGRSQGKDMDELARLVAVSRADFGVRIDPSGQRLSMVNEIGHVLANDRMALIVADLVAAEQQGGRIVLPLNTSRLAEKVASFHGATVVRTTPDQAGLAEAVADGTAILGADGDGGFIVPVMGAHADPFAALVRLLGLIARADLAVSQIDERIPQPFVAHTEIVTPWGRKASLMRMLTEIAQAAQHSEVTKGGLMVHPTADSWVFVQPDASEPTTRLWAESSSPDASLDLLNDWVSKADLALH
ncbi:sugar phosphate nucleotidyltransferase [Candidatus Nanopelagicales bacterium]|nr:sugar phosphate nucleotidyltransferase [Candidatus Nanopelagicales bacterium]